MSKNTSISLSEHHLEFLTSQVESGRYSSTSEAIRDALRLAEEREMKIRALDLAIQEGLDSGPARPFNWDKFIAEMHEETKSNP